MRLPVYCVYNSSGLVYSVTPTLFSQPYALFMSVFTAKDHDYVYKDHNCINDLYKHKHNVKSRIAEKLPKSETH